MTNDLPVRTEQVNRTILRIRDADEPITLSANEAFRLARYVEALEGALRAQPAAATPIPAQAPSTNGDALDAARYRFLAGHCRSTSEHWGGRWSIVIDGPAPRSHNSEDDFDAAIDTAMLKGEGA